MRAGGRRTRLTRWRGCFPTPPNACSTSGRGPDDCRNDCWRPEGRGAPARPPPRADRVLDLGAGTGRLSERLLAAGVAVVAVEPLAEMRAHIPSAAVVLAGTAEAIPLDDESLDAVLVGQAFHWFDAHKALAE